MTKSLSLKIIFLIALSGCNEKVVAPIQTIDMTNGLVNHREVTFDNKKCSMTSKITSTEALGQNQNGLICVTPEEFSKGFVRWKNDCQK